MLLDWAKIQFPEPVLTAHHSCIFQHLPTSNTMTWLGMSLHFKQQTQRRTIQTPVCGQATFMIATGFQSTAKQYGRPPFTSIRSVRPGEACPLEKQGPLCEARHTLNQTALQGLLHIAITQATVTKQDKASPRKASSPEIQTLPSRGIPSR